MMRYFFDLKTDAGVEHDYRGQYLSGQEQAKQMAELLAIDFGCTPPEGTLPVELQVRNARGLLLLSVPVLPMNALAA